MNDLDIDTVVNWKKIQRGLPKARLRANDRSPMAAASSPPSVAPVIDLALPLSVALDFKVRMFYVPSFLKYYMKYNIPMPDSIEFLIEEPFRYMLGHYYARKGRLHLIAKKPK